VGRKNIFSDADIAVHQCVELQQEKYASPK